MKNLVIFGKGPVAQIAKDYFTDDSDYNVVAFTLDGAYIDEDTYEGLPMVPFENIEEKYPASENDIFVGLSYTNMNKLREAKYNEAKSKGYSLATYISSKCSYLSKYPPGDNCFIFEDNTIQPYAELGNNIILWSGNHIGHHSKIDDHNFVSSHVVISGSCHIQRNCFLGVNSTLAHQTTLAPETLLAAGAIITKNTEEKGVYLGPRTEKFKKTSDQIKL